MLTDDDDDDATTHFLVGTAAEGQVGNVTASASLNWHWNWAESAARQYTLARQARAELDANPSGGECVPNEFYASLLAITASAFALEALKNELVSVGIAPTTVLAQIPGVVRKNTSSITTADRVFDALTCACGVDATTGKEIDWLFVTRNAAVHPRSKMEPTKTHPSKYFSVPGPNATYALENARRAIVIVRNVFCACTASPKPAAQQWLDRASGGVVVPLQRIDEVLT
jgi:hypothetical protein